ncbi:hypothetical protein JL721_10190 [Aureococcus anophagefferens]|nr:hypothetical protein JL721_10190 [Aureococcus anophagefferens]
MIMNSAQVSGSGQLAQASKIVFADGPLTPFRTVGRASIVAWFFQYSVMGFIFQACDRAEFGAGRRARAVALGPGAGLGRDGPPVLRWAVVSQGYKAEGLGAFITAPKWFSRVMMNAPIQGTMPWFYNAPPRRGPRPLAPLGAGTVAPPSGPRSRSAATARAASASEPRRTARAEPSRPRPRPAP